MMSFTSADLAKYGISKPFMFGPETEASFRHYDKYLELFIAAVANDVLANGFSFINFFPCDLSDNEGFNFREVCVKLVYLNDMVRIELMAEKELADFGKIAVSVKPNGDSICQCLKDISEGSALVLDHGAPYSLKEYVLDKNPYIPEQSEKLDILSPVL